MTVNNWLNQNFWYLDIDEAYENLEDDKKNSAVYIDASTCNLCYQPMQPPIVTKP